MGALSETEYITVASNSHELGMYCWFISSLAFVRGLGSVKIAFVTESDYPMHLNLREHMTPYKNRAGTTHSPWPQMATCDLLSLYTQ